MLAVAQAIRARELLGGSIDAEDLRDP